jgi:hypothetical protein
MTCWPEASVKELHRRGQIDTIDLIVVNRLTWRPFLSGLSCDAVYADYNDRIQGVLSVAPA